MTEFITHTADTAPDGSRNLLNKAEQQLGFIPNLLGTIAESPATLKAYNTLTSLFDKTAFTITERQLILLSISRFRNCCYCLAAHSTLAKKQKISDEVVQAIYFNQPLEDCRLEALRQFTITVLETKGQPDQQTLLAFYQAGYQKQHVLEVILGISFKTLSNYINHINDTPIDTEFLPGIPNSRPTNKQIT